MNCFDQPLVAAARQLFPQAVGRRGALPRMIHKLLLLMALSPALQTGAWAGYLINPAGGTVLFNDSVTLDDVVVNRPIGFTGSFYGVSFSSIYVSTNGNLNFSGTTAYTNSGLPNSIAMIAPLWDDLEIFAGTGQSIVESAVPGQYYAVTWDISQYNNTLPRYQFQTVIFGADTMIGGMQFLQNDIVFAYQRVDAVFNNNSATVGLNAGDGVNFTSLPGMANGNLSDANVGLLPVGPCSGRSRPACPSLPPGPCVSQPVLPSQQLHAGRKPVSSADFSMADL